MMTISISMFLFQFMCCVLRICCINNRMILLNVNTITEYPLQNYRELYETASLKSFHYHSLQLHVKHVLVGIHKPLNIA